MKILAFLLYYFCLYLCQIISYLFIRLKTIGRQNLPKKGSYIIACNHISHLDPPLVGIAHRRMLRYIAKIELFKNPFFALLFKNIGLIAIHRAGVDPKAIRTALDCLSKGERLLLFPEGTRSLTGQLGKAQSGVGLFAEKSRVPVVPACIIGTYELLPPGAKFPKPGIVKIVFGKPILYTDVITNESDPNGKQIFSEVVFEEIRQLLRQNGAKLSTTEQQPSIGNNND